MAPLHKVSAKHFAKRSIMIPATDSSFMDYGIPRAAVMPPMTFVHHDVACTTNPLGVKGAGEAGTTAAPCAIMNAIIDALPGDAAAVLEMPATTERIWRALRNRTADVQ